MEEESVKFQNERADRSRRLHERQSKEIENFDLQSNEMGMNALEIAEASQIEPFPEDDVSIRGSIISLSASSSSSSFSQYSQSAT